MSPEKLQNVVLCNGDLSAIEGRCDGHTTGLVLKAIGYAMTNPDVAVSLFESDKHIHHQQHLLGVARSLIDHLHLKHLKVDKKGNDIFIIFKIHSEIRIGNNNDIHFTL